MDSDAFRKFEFLRTHQRRRYASYKMRILTKEEKDLQKWKSTYAVVKQAQNKYLESALRKIRVQKLLQFIKESLKNSKRRTCKVGIRKPSIDSIKRRWQLAKEKGNEYSKFNKYNNFSFPALPKHDFGISKEREIEVQRARARAYGNMLSKINLERIQKYREMNQRPESPRPSELDKSMERRRNLLDYGSYYSMRNKLSFKDSVGQFDYEYQDLLLKCVMFEKEHIEVTGFLEEKFRCNMELRRNIMALANSSSSPPPKPKERKVKKPVPVASHDHTMQIINVEKIPSNEIFVSFTKIVKPSEMPTVSTENIKAETVVNAYRYGSSDNIGNTCKTQGGSLDADQNSIKNRPLAEDDSFYRISEAVTKNAYFEDTILDVMKNYRPAGADNLEVQKLLSDLYLAFCMNLMKTAVNEKFIKDEIDMCAVKEVALRQADAMSGVLSEIFQHRKG